jgi:hypothetical protein
MENDFFVSGKIEFLVRGTVFGGDKKIEMFFHLQYD